MKTIKTDVCVIGAGSGGLSYAAGAVQMGAEVVLLEGGKMGGDCLNYGCVPSKALLAAGKAAVAGRDTEKFGITHGAAKVDYAKAMDHVHDVIAQIAPHDSVERFESLGCTVITEAGQFIDEKTVQAGDTQIQAKRFIVATGSGPFVPPIPGLDTVPYLTNESLWQQRELPKELLVIGGGAIGLEMALAHQRLGSKVTVFELASILPKDDPDMVEVARDSLVGEGLTLLEGAGVKSVGGKAGAIEVTYEKDGEEHTVKGTDLLVAVGRRPNVDGLGLEAAGIKYDRRGIETNAQQRTSNRRVLAIGDVAASFQFTHYAGHQASIAIQNTILPSIPGRKVVSREDAVPWVTFIDPEVAQVGLNETAAKAKGIDYRVERVEFGAADRLIAERKTKGFVKVLLDTKDRVIGAGIVGPSAGELIHHWALAVYNRSKITSIASFIAPYPTAGELNKKVTSRFIGPKIFSPLVKRIVRFWLRFL